MKKLENIHPGEVLMEEFLLPMEITAYRLSKDLDIPQTRISQILKGKRRMTADTAFGKLIWPPAGQIQHQETMWLKAKGISVRTVLQI
jgi:addiction module HigA family antidote